MNGRWCLLVLVSAALLTGPARAGIIFGKKKPVKVEPAQRVPELLSLAKSGPDESKRSEAVEELRQYDPLQFPEMIPILIDVLQNDAKSGVRMSAVSTLSKLRPVTQEVGLALEQALAKDSSMRVRLHTRSSLLQYHWAGFRSPKKDGPQLPPAKEMPLSTPESNRPGMPLPPSAIRTPKPTPLPPIHTTAPLPSPPVMAPMPSGGAQRMPLGPARPVRVPPVPVKTTPAQGPDLGSPY